MYFLKKLIWKINDKMKKFKDIALVQDGLINK
jgi:hypothetical protein